MRECVERKVAEKLILASGRVGALCRENVDCISGDAGTMYCNDGQCACLPEYVTVEGFCYISKQAKPS